MALGLWPVRDFDLARRAQAPTVRPISAWAIGPGKRRKNTLRAESPPYHPR